MNNLKKIGIVSGILFVAAAVIFSAVTISVNMKISDRYDEAAKAYGDGKIEQALVELDRCLRESFSPSPGMLAKINIMKSEIYTDMGLYQMAEKYINLAIGDKTPTAEQEQLKAEIIEAIELQTQKQAANDDVLERYYDYGKDTPQIIMLFQHEPGMEFIDDEMSAFALVTLHKQGRLDIENGNSIEEFDEITEKYFGKKIENFNNSKSVIKPGTNRVISTGWDYSTIHMLLRDLKENVDGVKTGVFYTLVCHPGDEWPDDEQVKRDLLSGNFKEYGVVSLIELTFRELYDENGDMYFQFIAAEQLLDSGGAVRLYGAE